MSKKKEKINKETLHIVEGNNLITVKSNGKRLFRLKMEKEKNTVVITPFELFKESKEVIVMIS